MTPTAEAGYRARQARFAAERDSVGQRWNLLANLRLVAFILAAAALFWGIRDDSTPLLVVSGLIFLLFTGLVRYHASLGQRRHRAATLAKINAEAAARASHDWHNAPLRHTSRAATDHPFATDLDLFGPASLFHRIDTVTTPTGEATLASWLCRPAKPTDVRARQMAIAELAADLRWRQAFQAHGWADSIQASHPDPAPFLAWAEGEPWLQNRNVLRGLSLLSPALLWLMLIGQVIGVIERPWWILFLSVNVIIGQTLGSPIHARLEEIRAQHGALSRYAAMIQAVTGTPFTTPLLRQFQSDLTAAGVPAHVALRRLDRWATLVIPTESLAHGLVQAFTVWDVHVLAALEGWQDRSGAHCRGWLTILGAVEALSALAVLAHDEPEWGFPDLDPTALSLTARGLGHPLIAPERRVVNDVTVGPAGTFLLVTGSNMSGKSTLLRALGVNIVLAGAGAPVCATECRLPPVELWTSVHIEDSLARGVSLFLAELQRLKRIVDAARSAEAKGVLGPPVFYLLDELLQGTNSVERQIAARRVINSLASMGALGAVSTHDLTLADAPDLHESAQLVHFIDSLISGDDGPEMVFSYRLHPGIATSTNALRLMELIGLDLSSETLAQRDCPADQS
ncbi:MAG: DNA mismatch repair protein MutS [Chloroflexota bacterium]|nr:DNA mismatch repair protein MutS [Chloroflexota bacterium]